MVRLLLCLILLPGLALARTAHKSAPPPPVQTRPLTPPAQCEAAAASAEAQQSLPARVLHAISIRESGRRDPETGRVRPWPWTINFEGAGRFYPTKEEAIAAVQQIQAAGGQSIDVGCMQVNLMHHPYAFATLDEAFDPVRNATYAGGFLRSLFASAGDWGAAIGAYHSRTPGVSDLYRDQVLAAWSPSDPAVLARLNAPFSSYGYANSYPLAPLQTAGLAPTQAWPPAVRSLIVPIRAPGQYGSVYRSFLPASLIYADFTPRAVRARPRARPLDLRVGTGLAGGPRGLVVPRGVIERGVGMIDKPPARKTAATRHGEAG